jgi:hypothetical protein
LSRRPRPIQDGRPRGGCDDPLARFNGGQAGNGRSSLRGGMDGVRSCRPRRYRCRLGARDLANQDAAPGQSPAPKFVSALSRRTHSPPAPGIPGCNAGQLQSRLRWRHGFAPMSQPRLLNISPRSSEQHCRKLGVEVPSARRLRLAATIPRRSRRRISTLST